MGTQLAVDTAHGLVRDGGAVALVGAPHGGIGDLAPVFLRNLTVSGGLAPARSPIPALLEDVRAGRLDPSPVFDLVTDLAGAPAAYQAMAERTALKALIRMCRPARDVTPPVESCPSPPETSPPCLFW